MDGKSFNSSTGWSRRRAFWTASMLFAALALSLCALAVRQVASESRSFVEEKERILQERIDLEMRSLRQIEKTIIDRLDEAVTSGTSGALTLRSIEDERDLVARSFVRMGDQILWPASPSLPGAQDALPWESSGDTPRERRFLETLYDQVARKDVAGAERTLEQGRESRWPFPVRAEAELQLAALLALDGRGDEATACCDRVIAEARAAEARAARPANADALRWLAAASFRKAELLLERSVEQGTDALLELGEVLTGDPVYRPFTRLREFYLGRVLERLEDPDVRGELEESRARRATELRALANRQRDEDEFREDLERLWLPAVYAARAGPVEEDAEVRHLHLHPRGRPQLLVYRQETGDPARTLGFLVRMETLEERLRAALASLLEDLGGDVAASIRDRRGESPFAAPVEAAVVGDDVPANASEGATSEGLPVRATLGSDLPWTVEVSVEPALRRLRVQRSLVYGSGLALIVALLGLAIFTTLRAMHRQVELADLKSQFVANISHELKTPLTLIRMFTDLLRLGYSSDRAETERNLGIIAREADALGHLIDNVLEISRIEAGEKEYHPEMEDPARLVEEVLEGYQPYLERKGFSLRRDIGGDLPRVELDGGAFSQALRNLLSNAVKYSAERKEIDVSARRDEYGLAVEVADRGVGLAPGEANKVFDRFYRARSDSRAVPGTGIGLAIVHHVVQGHGGRVRATDRAGGGTRFSMYFPAGPEKGERRGSEGFSENPDRRG